MGAHLLLHGLFKRQDGRGYQVQEPCVAQELAVRVHANEGLQLRQWREVLPGHVDTLDGQGEDQCQDPEEGRVCQQTVAPEPGQQCHQHAHNAKAPILAHACDQLQARDHEDHVGAAHAQRHRQHAEPREEPPDRPERRLADRGVGRARPAGHQVAAPREAAQGEVAEEGQDDDADARPDQAPVAERLGQGEGSGAHKGLGDVDDGRPETAGRRSASRAIPGPVV
mmetsp:Transcript_80079/g.244831  ORF Transcript_80079/g.244831 Transcript_80079/m.244831 type:complete len:225 (-) Transcript_80079:62-736(-)